jgi:hypothetical protein
MYVGITTVTVGSELLIALRSQLTYDRRPGIPVVIDHKFVKALLLAIPHEVGHPVYEAQTLEVQ